MIKVRVRSSPERVAVDERTLGTEVLHLFGSDSTVAYSQVLSPVNRVGSGICMCSRVGFDRFGLTSTGCRSMFSFSLRSTQVFWTVDSGRICRLDVLELHLCTNNKIR